MPTVKKKDIKSKIEENFSKLMAGAIINVGKKSPAFQLYVQDFIVGTIHMTSNEVGGYILLLCFQWDKYGLKDDRDKLKKIARCDDETLSTILDKFIKCEDGKLRNKKLETIRAEQIANKEIKSISGLIGNEIRWGKTKKDVKIPSSVTPGSDFFYIGKDLFKLPVSEYIKDNMSIFLESWQMKNPTLKAENIFKILDKENIGTSYNDDNHIQNAFKKVGRDSTKKPFKKQETATVASVPNRVNLDN